MFLCVVGLATAQDPISDPNVVLETIMEEMEEEVEQDGADGILELLDDPMDLNTAEWNDLRRIPGVSPLLAYRITTYRQRTPFRSVADLLNVEGISDDIHVRVAPFVTVEPIGMRTTAAIRSRIRIDTEERRGFREGRYAGGRAGTQHRLLVKSDLVPGTHLETFILSAKDAGEPASASFLSGYGVIGFRDWRMIVGDIRVGTGLRIQMGSRTASSLSGPRSARSSGSVVQGYRSTHEAGILRGAAAEMAITKTLSLALFYSNRPVHGTVSPMGVLSPAADGGSFRTESERSRRNTSRERVMGAMLSWGDHLTHGMALSGFHGRFLHFARLGTVNPDTTRDFAGASMSGWLTAGTLSVAMECAVERGGALGAGVVLHVEPSSLWRVVVAGTAFNRGYTRPMAGIRNPAPESELYGSASVRVTNSWRLTGVTRWTLFPGGREPTGFGEMTGRSGVESIVTVARRTQVIIGWTILRSMETRPATTNQGLLQTFRGPVFRRHWRWGIVSGKGNPFQWSLRVDHMVFTGTGGTRERGAMLSQQGRWAVSDRIRVEAKISLYGSESFQSRLFTFEPDVPGSFAARMVYGRGSRIAGLVRVRPTDGAEISVSYATEVRDNVEQMGSGSDQLPGDHHGVVSVQVDVSL